MNGNFKRTADAIRHNLCWSLSTSSVRRHSKMPSGIKMMDTMQYTEWIRVSESDLTIKVETDKLEVVIPKKNPKRWMTGIEKGSFLDKTTRFQEAGDGMMVIDWLMEAGIDEAYGNQVVTSNGHGVGQYRWHTNESDPAVQFEAMMAHGSNHRKRIVESPQLCHRMKPVKPDVIRGKDFVAVKTTYQYEYAASGRQSGSGR